MTCALIIGATIGAAGSSYDAHQERRPDPPRPAPRLTCRYCGVTTYADHGECERCGAPLEVHS